MGQNKGFATEAIARTKAVSDFPNTSIYIIESQGQFYVEGEDFGGFLRSWEREVYHGLGKRAVNKNKKG